MQLWNVAHIFLVWRSTATLLNLVCKVVRSGDQRQGTTNGWTAVIYLQPSGFPWSDDQQNSVRTTTNNCAATLKNSKHVYPGPPNKCFPTPMICNNEKEQWKIRKNLPGLHSLCLKCSSHLHPLCTLVDRWVALSAKTSDATLELCRFCYYKTSTTTLILYSISICMYSLVVVCSGGREAAEFSTSPSLCSQGWRFQAKWRFCSRRCLHHHTTKISGY